jgi:hypothetical protein
MACVTAPFQLSNDRSISVVFCLEVVADRC